MSTPRIIPDTVRELQAAVSNPDTSAWVAANAGSGKTHVLVQRVINLLLDNVEPAKILCITFTKAAAANMAKRVFDRLAEWTTLDDAELDKAIRATSNVPVNAARRALARRLFAKALETPGGLKVQTIHAFCTQLLHQFPFEANVAARFTVLDATAETQLLQDLSLDVLLAAAGTPDSLLGRALATAITMGADQTFRDVVNEAIGKRDAILQAVERTGSVEDAIAALCGALGVAAGDTMAAVEAEIFSDSLIAKEEWPAVAAALAEGSKADGEHANRLVKLAALGAGEGLDLYLGIFCTDKFAPRKNIVTRAIRDRHPALFQRLLAEQERVCKLLDRRRALACRDRAAALLTVAHAVLARYQSEKDRRGLLDYDDLIDKALVLLGRVDAAWVHYKLDLGIDHVLIDEAQDTSAKQWEIICNLVAEFFAGAGARTVKRTIFVVGDEKQSIFSFQNAAPQEFADRRGYFQSLHSAADLPFIAEEIKQSFRSGEILLGAVDEVFKREDIRGSVTTDIVFPAHVALPDAAPSLVEIWEPVVPPAKKDGIEGWDAPFDTTSETTPRVKLAQRIARTVRGLIERRAPVGRATERRPMRPGDVLVLVRQRGPLFEAIIRALKNEGVAVAGADRLVLTEHIAVMDLIALADALLLPEDDLALATVLRSPLFGFTDDDLFKVAYNRGRSSLRATLVRKAAEDAQFGAAAARLDELGNAASHQTPFTFYARLLGAGGARRDFLARLGFEANDALDEFLNLALDYERRETPSLQGFVAWLRAAKAEIKRDMEIARDEVRVMTVHGAKGLEAPIVILADTVTPPSGPRPPRLLMLPGKDASPPHLIWAGRKDDDVTVVAASRATALAEAEHEYRRLLYVAMTRAAERLIVCGAEGERGRPKGCWYDLIREALQPALVEARDGDDKVWRYRKPADDDGDDNTLPASAARAVCGKIPVWLRSNAPVESPRAVPLSPSAAYDEAVAARPDRAVLVADRRKALARGRLVHRLMQSLPDIAPVHRSAAAQNFLARTAADFTAEEQEQIATQILGILADARFAALFAPGSRAEVSIVGRIARGGDSIAVAGQVDRLLVTDEAVLIADYKTNRDAPRRTEDVPPDYVAQLALYRAVLAQLYPGKPVRAALIWTDVPDLMEISPDNLDVALVEVMRRHAG